MSLKVKSVQVSAQKFVTRASSASGDYRDGVNSTNDQAERAIAAEDAYVQGVQDSISRGARVAGLQRSGNQKWKERSMLLGASRYAGGIKVGQAEYAKNVAPYIAALSGLNLTPRGPKGSPENYNRAVEVGQALHELKIATQTA